MPPLYPVLNDSVIIDIDHNDGDDICPICKVFVNEGVGCDSCPQWYHIKCVKIPKDVYNYMQSNNNLKWYCCSCSSTSGKVTVSSAPPEHSLSELIIAQQKIIDKLSNNMTDLKLEISDLASRLPPPAPLVLPTVNLTKMRPHTFQPTSNTHHRDLNVIVAGVPECSDEADDREFIYSLFDHLNLTCSSDVEEIVRLGNVDEARTKPRLIRLRFLNANARSMLLRAKSSLSEAAHPLKSVYIHPDRSRAQQLARKQLILSRKMSHVNVRPQLNVPPPPIIRTIGHAAAVSGNDLCSPVSV